MKAKKDPTNACYWMSGWWIALQVEGILLRLLATSWSGRWLPGTVQFVNICALSTFDRSNSLYVRYTPIKTWGGEWCQKRSFPLRVPLAKLLKGSRLISFPMETE